MPINETEIRQRLADPHRRRAAALEIGNWTRDLCLLFGTSLDTAYAVGGLMAHGLEQNWSEKVSANADLQA